MPTHLRPPVSRVRRLADVLGCQLWLLALDLPVAGPELAVLDAAERARAARLVFERDRQRFVAAHAALRQLLGQHLGLAPAAVRLAAGDNGKPLVPDAPLLRFSLSHSAGWGLVALAGDGVARDCPGIGVDLELLRPVPDALALAAQAPFEASAQHELRALSAEQRGPAFLTGWTRLEACLKACGSGFSGPAPAGVGIAAATGQAHWTDGSGQRARVQSFALPEAGALGALAVLEGAAPPDAVLAPRPAPQGEQFA